MSDVEASSDIDTAGNDKIDGKHYIPKKLLRRDPKLQAQVRIEKLFEKGEQGKEIILPNPPKTLLEKQMKMMKPPPEHVRNIQGSSAGAGSGEFHVYRALRRKEYARTKLLEEMTAQERADEEHRLKLEERRRVEEERTAKKREKRKRRNNNKGGGNKKAKATDNQDKSDDEGDDNDDDNNKSGAEDGVEGDRKE